MDNEQHQLLKDSTITTIQLHKHTRELLGQIGRKDQTYDELILDLIQARSKLLDIELKMKKIDEENNSE